MDRQIWNKYLKKFKHNFYLENSFFSVFEMNSKAHYVLGDKNPANANPLNAGCTTKCNFAPTHTCPHTHVCVCVTALCSMAHGKDRHVSQVTGRHRALQDHDKSFQVISL